jgi:hypothetical protein
MLDKLSNGRIPLDEKFQSSAAKIVEQCLEESQGFKMEGTCDLLFVFVD